MKRVRSKVLHIITHLDVGGAQDNTLLTVRDLCRDRYHVDLATAPHGEWLSRGGQYADHLQLIDAMRQDRGHVDPPADLMALLQILRLLREKQYDIVHTHSSKAGVLGRLAARLAGVPIIVHTIHGFPFHDHMSVVRRSAYVHMERWVGSFTDKLITVCDANRREALRHGIGSPDQLVTILSGIDFARFEIHGNRMAKRRLLGLDPHRPVVGTVGRLSRQKAPQDFVRAAQHVLQRRPEAQFVLVGDGPLRRKVASMIDGEPRIKLLGQRDDVPEILHTLDVFVLSSWWEGLGRALTEAMIVQLPVAATAVNGVPDLVVPGKTGLLSPSGDPEALARNITYLLTHPREARRYGRNAHALVVPAFSAARMVNQISDLYEDLLRAKRVPQPGAIRRTATL